MNKNIKNILIISFFITVILLIIIIGYRIKTMDKDNEYEEIASEENMQYESNRYNEIVVENNVNSISANGLELKFTESDTYFDLSYKYPRGAIVNSFEASTTITYLKGAAGDEVVFKISMNKMKQKKIEDFIKLDNIKRIGNKTINQINWDVYSNNASNIKLYTYLTKSGELYIFQLEANKDIESIEQEFMDNVNLKY